MNSDPDTENPTITAPADIIISLSAAQKLNVYTGQAQTSDNSAPAILSVTPDKTSPFPLGETVITWTVTDGSGNKATATQKVTVVPDGVLPVTLLSFNAQADGNRAKLTWSTATEKENKAFEIERSTDGNIFKSVITVNGKQNSAGLQHYAVYDPHPANGINYYRLVQVDNNGDKKVYDPKALRFTLEQKIKATVFPNPTSNEINIGLENYTGKTIKVDLLDINGHSIHQETIAVNADQSNTYKLNPAKHPAPGNYILHITGQDLKTSLSLVVL